MQLDLSAILHGETTELPIAFSYTPHLDEDFPDVTFGENVLVQGSVRDMAGYMCLTLEAQIPYIAVCARCLAEVKEVYRVSLTKEVADPSLLQEDEQDRYALIEGGMLDLDSILTDDLLISFPSKHLCREDCKGLCVRCGKDLNAGPCGCPEREPDPRLDALRKLLETKS